MTPMPPNPDELRATLRTFDQVQKRVFASLIVTMIEQSDKVKDREWIAEQFAQTASLALDLDLDPSVRDGTSAVEKVREYAKEHMSAILNVAYGVFTAVAQTMQAKAGGFSYEDAVQEALGYLEQGPP